MNRPRRNIFPPAPTAFVALGMLSGPAAWAGGNPFVTDSDARPRVQAGKIVLDAFDDSTSQLVPNVYTFGWSFLSIPGDPYFLQDPGFNAVAGSGLPGGSLLGFDVTLGLSHWAAAPLTPVRFGAIPAGESLHINFGAATVTISGTTGPQSGFNFVTIAGNGSAHRHLNSFLRPGTLATPTTGVYLTAIRVRNTGVPTASDPMMLLFNNGALHADFERALDYVANPFPGDANYSGIVDIADFSILAARFNAAGNWFWYDGDFTGDYTVNIADFSLLASHFNQSAPVLPRGAAPEPGAILATAAAIALAARRSRPGCSYGGGQCSRHAVFSSPP